MPATIRRNDPEVIKKEGNHPAQHGAGPQPAVNENDGSAVSTLLDVQRGSICLDRAALRGGFDRHAHKPTSRRSTVCTRFETAEPTDGRACPCEMLRRRC